MPWPSGSQMRGIESNGVDACSEELESPFSSVLLLSIGLIKRMGGEPGFAGGGVDFGSFIGFVTHAKRAGCMPDDAADLLG